MQLQARARYSTITNSIVIMLYLEYFRAARSYFLGDGLQLLHTLTEIGDPLEHSEARRHSVPTPAQRDNTW